MRTVGRFAPTPSGRMHLGNVFAALVAWLSVRKDDGHMVLRMEDLDTQRTSAEFAQVLREDLLWLGLDWDEETQQRLQIHLPGGRTEQIHTTNHLIDPGKTIINGDSQLIDIDTVGPAHYKVTAMGG